MWDLAPWAGIEPGPPAWGAQSFSHWITRKVHKSLETKKQKTRGKARCASLCVRFIKSIISLSLGPAQVSPFSSLSSPLHPLQRDPSLCLLLWESRGSRTLGSGCWRCQEEWGILGKSPPSEVPPLSLDSLGWQRNSGEHQRGELRGWGRMGTDKGLQIRTAVSTVNYEPDQRKL